MPCRLIIRATRDIGDIPYRTHGLHFPLYCGGCGCRGKRVRSWTNACDLSPVSWTKHWPHQVPLPAYRCLGHNDLSIQFFCEELSLYPRTHCFRRGDVDMSVFCFGERVHPSSSLVASGELMDCAMGPRWLATRA